MDLVRRRIGSIAAPDAIQWVAALPKTRSGKVLRQLLQKIAAGDIEKLGDIVSVIADPSLVAGLISDRMGAHS